MPSNGKKMGDQNFHHSYINVKHRDCEQNNKICNILKGQTKESAKIMDKSKQVARVNSMFAAL